MEISEMIQDAIHQLTEAEMESHERARLLRAEALHRLTGALREVVAIERALAQLVRKEDRAYEGTD
jgi:hypothetical protein